MNPRAVSASLPLSPPFERYELQGAFDEMFSEAGDPRAHYRALVARLREIPIPELQRHQQAADRAFLTQGITFPTRDAALSLVQQMQTDIQQQQQQKQHHHKKNGGGGGGG